METIYKYSPLNKRVVFSRGLFVWLLPAVREPSKLYDCWTWLVWLLWMVRAPCQVLPLVQEAYLSWMDVAHPFSVSANGCGGKYLLRGFQPRMIFCPAVKSPFPCSIHVRSYLLASFEPNHQSVGWADLQQSCCSNGPEFLVVCAAGVVVLPRLVLGAVEELLLREARF